jgi:hypothetical protein
MPTISRAETYFIAAMMFLIIVLCVSAVYFFIKTYRKEMRDKEERLGEKKNAKGKNEIGTSA